MSRISGKWFLDHGIVFVLTIVAAVIALKYENASEERAKSLELDQMLRSDIKRMAELIQHTYWVERDFSQVIGVRSITDTTWNAKSTPTRWTTFQFHASYLDFISFFPPDSSHFLQLLAQLDQVVEGMSRAADEVERSKRILISRSNEVPGTEAFSIEPLLDDYVTSCDNLLEFALFARDYASCCMGMAERERGITVRHYYPLAYEYVLDITRLSSEPCSFQCSGTTLDQFRARGETKVLIKHANTECPEISAVVE